MHTSTLSQIRKDGEYINMESAVDTKHPIQLVIDEFLNDLEYKRTSEHTFLAYRFVLQNFLSSCSKPNVEEITSEDVLIWMGNYGNEKVVRTLMHRLTVLSCFFNFSISQMYIVKNPVKRSWRRKIPKSLPQFMGKNDHTKARLVAEMLPLRDRAIISLLDYGGIRRAELANLDVQDFNFEKRTIRVLGKGGNQRIVGISVESAVLAQKLISSYPKDQSAMFLNRYGKRISTQMVYRTSIEVGKRANLTYRLNPHRWRHTMATDSLSSGKTLEQVKQKLGHKNYSTTTIYARILKKDLILAYEKAMEE